MCQWGDNRTSFTLGTVWRLWVVMTRIRPPASRAPALGETLPVTGKLLGHSSIETTACYVHLARDFIHDAANRIAERNAADIL